VFSLLAEKRVVGWKWPIWLFLSGLVRKCFKNSAGHNLKAFRAIKWSIYFFPDVSKVTYDLLNRPCTTMYGGSLLARRYSRPLLEELLDADRRSL
jgi:hypothetical protein